MKCCLTCLKPFLMPASYIDFHYGLLRLPNVDREITSVVIGQQEMSTHPRLMIPLWCV